MGQIRYRIVNETTGTAVTLSQNLLLLKQFVPAVNHFQLQENSLREAEHLDL